MNVLSSTEQGGIVAVLGIVVLGIVVLGDTTETSYRRGWSPVEVSSYVDVDDAREAIHRRSVSGGRSRPAGVCMVFLY